MIRKAEAADCAAIARIAAQIWHSESLEALTQSFARMAENDDIFVAVAEEEGRVVGFAQCGLRHDYVEGTASSPVGYLEGICIEENFRGRGHARALVSGCMAWAKARGCTEFASDCELDNTASAAFHKSLGFEEANRIVCFTRRI